MLLSEKMQFGDLKNSNKYILEQIQQYKKIIVEAREEKLKYDLQINKTQKNLREFEEKKELMRRELLNELIPVNKSPNIGNKNDYRNIKTAPENINRRDILERSTRNERNIQSANINIKIQQAIKDSIQALPGISEQMKNPSMVEAFRQSYIRDLQDYLKIKGEHPHEGNGNEKKEEHGFDRNFSFKKKSMVNSLSNKKYDINVLKESNVIDSKNASQISKSSSTSKRTMEFQNNEANPKLLSGNHPKINFKKSINQLSGINDSEIQIDREIGGNSKKEVIETIEELECERDTYFGTEGEEEIAGKRNSSKVEERGDLETEFQIEDEDQDFEEYKTLDNEEAEGNLEIKESEYQKMANVPTFRPKETFGLDSNAVLVEDNRDMETFEKRDIEKKIELRDSENYKDIPIVNWDKEVSVSEENNVEDESFETNKSTNNSKRKRRSSNVIRNSKNSMMESKKKKGFRIKVGSSRQSTTSMRSHKGSMNQNTESDIIDFKIQEDNIERRTEALTPNIEKHALKKNEILKNFEFDESDINFLKKKESVKYKTLHNERFEDEEKPEGFRGNQTGKAKTQVNFSKRNKMFIDRFDAFFDKMNIKEEANFAEGDNKKPTETPKSQLKTRRPNESRYQSYSNYSDINQSHSSEDNQFSSEFQEEGEEEEIDEEEREEVEEEDIEDSFNGGRPMTRERPTNRLKSVDYEDLSGEIRDEVHENDFNGENTDKTTLGGYKESYGYSECLDEEAIELSQGTKDIKSLFKNRLHLNRTGKSNRYGGYGGEGDMM